MKLHCTYAGFIRATALHRQTIKGIETRAKSTAIGKSYRGWVAIASTHAPTEPNWQLVKQVAKLAGNIYGEEEMWRKRLSQSELYSPGHILAVARVADVYEMTLSNFPDSELEELVGGWEPGRWAIKLENAIAPTKPIPYNIPGQGAIYLNERHGIVYEQIMELIRHD